MPSAPRRIFFYKPFMFEVQEIIFMESNFGSLVHTATFTAIKTTLNKSFFAEPFLQTNLGPQFTD